MAIARLLLRPPNNRGQYISPFPSSGKTAVRCGIKEGCLGGSEDHGKIQKSAVAVMGTSPEAVAVSGTGEQAQRENSLAKWVGTVLKAVRAGEQEFAIFDIQMLAERAMLDCRFFTLLAVAGSLLGSVLCFLEGCFFVAESYCRYFHTLSQRSDQGQVVQLLMEAIGMFSIGIALYRFGVGLHVMFVGLNKLKQAGPGSNLLGLFHLNLKGVPRWVEVESVSRAKSRIAHAVVMIFQVGLVDKFTHTSLVTSLDLACFAAALLVSSASMFLLSRLSQGTAPLK